MKSWLSVGRILACGVAMAVWIPLTSAVPLVYYTVSDAQLGTTSAPMLVPSIVDVNAASGDARVKAVFDQLRAIHPNLFGNAQLSVGSDFDVTGQVVVQVEGLNEDELGQLASEVYATLTVHGARSITIPAVSGAPLTAEQVAYAWLRPVVPGWEALPPRSYPGSVIALGDGAHISSEEFYDRLKKRDKALSASVAKALQSPNPAAKARLLASLDELALDDPSAAALPLLQDSSARVKLAAVRALDSARSQPKVKAALEAVVEKDPDPEVKAAAVRLLIAAGERKYEIFAYIEKLKDPNDAVVLDAVQKLASSGNAAVSPALADALSHNSVEVREAALAGLVKLGNGDAMVRALESDKVGTDAKLAVAKSLTGVNGQQYVVRGLSHIVEFGAAADATRAAQGLGQLKDTSAVPALTRALENSNESVRLESAKALGEIGSAEAVPALAKMASLTQTADRDAGREAALRILTAQPQGSVIELSRSDDVGTRRLAIMALSSFGDGGRNRAVVGTLRERLKDPVAEIRQAAAYALARIPDEGVASELLALKNDSDEVVRAQVATAMGWSNNPSGEQTLIELLGDSSSDVKRAAAASLAQKKARGALDALLQYVSYGKPEVRRAVFQALVSVTTPADVEKLLDVYSTALYDQDAEVKLLAIQGISNFRDPRTVTALGGLTIDANPGVQKAALAALGSFQDPNATESIARALFAEDKTVRMAALEALGAAGQDNAQKPLQEFIKNEADADLRNKANEVYDSL